MYFKASNETLEAYYIIIIAGVVCFVLSLVWKSIDYVNCSILEQFQNFSNLPFYYYIRRCCRFNNPFMSSYLKGLPCFRASLELQWLTYLLILMGVGRVIFYQFHQFERNKKQVELHWKRVCQIIDCICRIFSNSIWRMSNYSISLRTKWTFA